MSDDAEFVKFLDSKSNRPFWRARGHAKDEPGHAQVVRTRRITVALVVVCALIGAAVVTLLAYVVENGLGLLSALD